MLQPSSRIGWNNLPYGEYGLIDPDFDGVDEYAARVKEEIQERGVFSIRLEVESGAGPEYNPPLPPGVISDKEARKAQRLRREQARREKLAELAARQQEREARRREEERLEEVRLENLHRMRVRADKFNKVMHLIANSISCHVDLIPPFGDLRTFWSSIPSDVLTFEIDGNDGRALMTFYRQVRDAGKQLRSSKRGIIGKRFVNGMRPEFQYIVADLREYRDLKKKLANN